VNYEEAIDWLYSTQMFGIKLGLDGPKQLLRKFLAFPKYGAKVIHVAGTNGKGSTCAMIELLVRGAGLKTGLFTSPHLIHYRERVRVNGVEIDEVTTAKYLTQLRDICEKLATHPTFFEITLALGMRYFKDCGCDVIVLETGMGGRLDATTAVPADVCVITPVAMDHSQWLGETLGEIAAEKAGIMLEGVPCLIAGQDPEAEEILLEEANMRRTPATILDDPLVGYSINIPGEHQRYNANLAVHAVHELGIPLNYDNVKWTMEHVRWPGRFETVEYMGREMILDGAHNPHAAESLMKTWRSKYGDVKATVICGVVESKDITGVIRFFGEVAERLILTPINSPRSLTVDQLKEGLGEDSELEVVEAKDADDAMEQARGYDDPILVAGSLFLIGDVKAKVEGGDFQRSVQ